MREINECTAEVFRRSENRIEERKRNRNRILAFCFPLCLILTVISITILPSMFLAETDKTPPDGFKGPVDSVTRFESVAITVSFKTIIVTDPDRIVAIDSAIRGLYDNANSGTYGDNSNAQKDEKPDEDAFWGDGLTTATYTICFIGTDSSEVRFVLNDHELRNTHNHHRIRLSQKQLNELLALFGPID